MKGLILFKKLCLIFVYVFCRFVSGIILWFGDNLWSNDLHAEYIGNRSNIVFSSDIILCG